MAIAVTCECGKNLRLKDDLGGRRIRCPECQVVFRVPLSNGAPVAAKTRPPAPAEDDDALPPRKTAPSEWDEDAPRTKPKPPAKSAKSSKPAKKSRLLLWLVLAAVTGFLIVGGAAAYVVLGTDLVFGKPKGISKYTGLVTDDEKLGKPDKTPPVVVAEPLFKRQFKGMTNAAMSPDGKWVAVVHEGGLTLLDTADGQERGSQDKASWQRPDAFSVWKVLFTPDSKALILSFGSGKALRVSVPDCKVEGEFDEGPNQNRFLTFTQSGALLAGYANTETREFIIRDLTANKEVARLKHDGPVERIWHWCIAPDGTRALALDDDRRLLLVQWQPEKKITVLEERSGDTGAFNRATAGNPATDTVAVAAWSGPKGGHQLLLWDLKTGTKSATWDLEAAEAVGKLAMSPDGQWVISATKSGAVEQPEVHIWNVAGQRKAAVLKGATQPVDRLGLSPDLTRAAGLDSGGMLYLWDLTPAFAKK